MVAKLLCPIRNIHELVKSVNPKIVDTFWTVRSSSFPTEMHFAKSSFPARFAISLSMSISCSWLVASMMPISNVWFEKVGKVEAKIRSGYRIKNSVQTAWNGKTNSRLDNPCDQIWLILKVLGDSFSQKSSPNI